MSNLLEKGSEFSSGIELKIARLRAGIKQYELASQVNITPSHLSEIESGRREVSLELSQKLVAAIQSLSPAVKKVSGNG